MSNREPKTGCEPDSTTEVVLPPRRVCVSLEALFRYRVVSEVISRRKGGEKPGESVRNVSDREHADSTGQMRQVPLRTLYRWLDAYNSEGLAGLEPRTRKGSPCTCTALKPELIKFLETSKESGSKASVPELIRRAREKGVLSHDEPVDRTTVYRNLVRRGLPVSRRSTKRDRDSRRFAYPHRMMMMLVDGKHFRAGATRKRRVAFFFLDDCTRKALHVVVGTKGEAAQVFLRGLYQVVLKYGVAVVVFLDNGAAFIANDSSAVIGQLEMNLVLGTAGYPEGHGKIERFNRTASDGVLCSLTRPEVDPTVAELELRLQHFLDDQYNRRPHEALNGQSPQQRWEADSQPLRFVASEAALRERFMVSETRQVSNDHTIPFSGTDYEVPRGYATTRIPVFRNVLDDSLYILHQGHWSRLSPVDLSANAYARRARPGSAEPAEQSASPPEPTAACLAFDRDFGPVVTADGGCPEPVRVPLLANSPTPPRTENDNE